MTIQLPGFADSIQPGLQGLTTGIQQLVNPDWQRQQALREMMLRNPELQQQLTDMGSQRVEEVYGKGTGGFAGSGPISTKKQLENATTNAIQQVLSLPDDDPRKVEFIANRAGIADPTERAAKVLRMKADQLQVNEMQRKADEKAAADAMALKIQTRLGTDPKAGDLYQLSKSGKIAPNELATLLTDPVYKSKYENDQQDYWHGVTADIEQQRVNAMHQGNRMALQEFQMRADYTRAAQIAEKYGGDPAAIMKVMKDPVVYHQYADMTKPPTDSEGLAYYEAAQQIKKMRDDIAGKDFKDADKEFRIANAADMSKMESNKYTPDQKRAMLEEINAKARAIYGRIGLKDIPQWHYDDQNSKLSHGFLGIGKNDAFYRQGGDPTLFGTGENYVPNKEVVGTPSKDPRVEAAAQDVISGKASLGELLAKAPDPKLRDELQRRVKELGGGKDSATTTGADSTVKSALKIPTDTMNLSIGKDKTDSISKAVTARDLPTSKLVEYFTEGMTGKEKQNATAEILAMSQNEKDTILKKLQEDGKIK